MPRKAGTESLTLIERIQARTVHDPVTGCDIWQGGTSAQGNYPTVLDGDRVVYCHRAIYEHARGPIPETPPVDGSHRYEIHHNHFNCGAHADKRCLNVNHMLLLSSRAHAKLHAEQRAQARAAKAGKSQKSAA
jgi:hypothetical protein